MDLCLRGSQINLVTREKPKSKHSSQSNSLLLQQQRQRNHVSRPRSASYCTQTCRYSKNLATSSFVHFHLSRRPQSAEGKFGRRCDSANSNRNYSLQQRRYQSISSSNLLKLLLEEPIKRSWLCRDDGGSGGGDSFGLHSSQEDNPSDWSSSAHQQYLNRTRHQCIQQRRERCKSPASSNSSIVDHSELCDKRVDFQVVKMSTNIEYDKDKSIYNNKNKNCANDYWKVTNSSSSGGSNSNVTAVATLSNGFGKMLKPDLPGRVSFCKSRNQAAQSDVDDSSDFENDKQHDALTFMTSIDNKCLNSDITVTKTSTTTSTASNRNTNNTTEENSFKHIKPSVATTIIKAIPSTNAVTTPMTTIAATTTSVTTMTTMNADFCSHSALQQKKSVHFSSMGSAEIHAETYEYPKCPSENCSCSTRSSSTASLHDVLDGKCACGAPTCRYTVEAKSNCDNNDITNTAKTLTKDLLMTNISIENPLEESAVIREYKNVIGDKLDSSIVKNLLAVDCGTNSTALSKSTAMSTSMKSVNFDHLSNGELLLPNYLEKFSRVEKQNNLSEIAVRKSAGIVETAANTAAPMETAAAAVTGTLYKANSKCDLLSVDDGGEQFFGTGSSETVINNYLKVTTGSINSGGCSGVVMSSMPKKQENAKPNLTEQTVLTRNRLVYNTKNSSNTITKNNKSSNSNTLKIHNENTNRVNRLHKSKSYGSLRGDDTNLNEFQLDKVDSWMSMHQTALNDGGIDGSCGPISKLPIMHINNIPDDDEVLAVVKHKNKFKLQRINDSAEGLREQQADEDDFKSTVGEEDNDDDEDDERNERQEQSKIGVDDENSQDDSTYDEIVSVIKEIENDKKYDNYAERSSEMNIKSDTPINDLEATKDTNEKSTTQPTIKKTTTTPILSLEMEAGNRETLDKYNDILNYLDNVEDSCDKTLLETRRSIPESNRGEIEFVVEPDISEDVPKLVDLLLQPNHQLARRVVALSLRANELVNALHLSKEHVSKLRVEKQKSVRAEKTNTTQRMREQKKHYETIVQRHQSFIEQLLKDKATLCDKVAALTRRLESQNQAWEHKLQTEVARVKETTLAGEKIRRERWVRENTKKIKELTVKGLEHEINKMNNLHQQEVNELKRIHQQQMLDAVEEMRIKHEQIENGIRETCAKDREIIIEKERNAIRERFERQLEEEHRIFNEQKQKLCEDFALERERLHLEIKSKDADYQQKRNDLQREKEQELEQTLSELQQKMCKQEEKYQNRINTIERQYESDFEIWKREYENSCKLVQVDKENSIRQHYRAERDRQIDAIVNRMDAEALKNSQEFEAKVNRMKEKYEKDLLEVENVEKLVREKYTETRNKLAESDAQVRNFQAEIKQLQIELDHSKKMCEDFVTERDQLRGQLRKEVQIEVATLKAEHDQEIQKIYRRVQQAIEKKDTTIDILQKENGSLRERCLKLEAIIRQQRKDYCVK